VVNEVDSSLVCGDSQGGCIRKEATPTLMASAIWDALCGRGHVTLAETAVGIDQQNPRWNFQFPNLLPTLRPSFRSQISDLSIAVSAWTNQPFCAPFNPRVRTFPPPPGWAIVEI
jgi:hypothetical protein